jgi:hypothetical protein
LGKRNRPAARPVIAYSEIACVGQVEMQAPQSMQVSASHTALSFSMESAVTGQTSTQAPQPMQVSLSILTAMISTPYKFPIFFNELQVFLVKENELLQAASNCAGLLVTKAPANC